MGQLHQLPVRQPDIRNGFADINCIFRINDNLRHSAIAFLQHGNLFEVVLYEPHCFLYFSSLIAFTFICTVYSTFVLFIL